LTFVSQPKSMERPQTFTKVDLAPKKWHAYTVLLFIAGTLFPPLAVAARFGIGGDFWLNLLLTICGYIPGHVHNFYIQNIRNNKNHKRTPKWAQRYGLVDTTALERRKKRTQWANRYNDRLPQSTLHNQPYAEGQEGGSSIDLSTEGNARANRANGDGLWRAEDEQYYGQNGDSASTGSGGRWHYPANFEDTLIETAPKKKKKEKKDRWARTEDAYSVSEGDPAPRKRKKSKRSKPTTDYENPSGVGGSTTDLPDDSRRRGSYENRSSEPANNDNVFSHQF